MSEDLEPEEKVKELIDKFKSHVLGFKGSKEEIYRAKQCALICVDEIMHAIPAYIHPSIYMPIHSYWKQAKDRIEKS